MDLINLDLHIPFDVTLDVEPSIIDATNNAGHGDERWRMLWHDPMRSQHLDDTKAVVESLQSNCRNLLLVGIGGSALGAKALHNALLSCIWMVHRPAGPFGSPTICFTLATCARCL